MRDMDTKRIQKWGTWIQNGYKSAGLSVLLNSLFGVWNGWNMTLCSMHFNDVNLALGIMLAAFRGVGLASSGFAPEVLHSCVFHPCHLVPRFPLPRFPPLLLGAAFSTPVFSTPAFSAPPPITVSEIYPYIGRKLLTPCIWRPRWEWSRQISATTLGDEKLEWWAYQRVKEFWQKEFF